jgi:tetratricopeptide (TPR) repeat protein
VKRPARPWNRVVLLLLVVPGLGAALVGCGSSGGDGAPSHSELFGDGDAASKAGSGAVSKAELIKVTIEMLRDAEENPGTTSFSNAAANLNQVFEGTPDADFAMSPEAREYLKGELPRQRFDAAMRALESRKFETPEARHIEDCLLYQAVAARAAGDGDDLDRLRRLFDWVVAQVALVPPEALGGGDPDFRAPARPYDVLLRGLAVEREEWSERSWVFITLCRQLGFDAGLLAYAPPGQERRVPWVCAAIVGGKPYLFDARIGLPVPGPGGRGIATLEQAATDPSILARLDLPESPYGTTAADLAPGRVAVWIDSTFAFVAPRMRLLQRELAGDLKMVLFRDPGAQAAAFRKALGPYASEVRLWALPMEVSFRLVTDGAFVQATQSTLRYFDASLRLPLLPARMQQLRASNPERMEKALESYVRLRIAEKLVMSVPTGPGSPPRQVPVPPEIQGVLNLYATYYLALCHLDLGHPDDARRLFEQSLKLAPAAEASGVYVPAFQYGARANLGRLYAAAGDLAGATHYLGQADPTPQGRGNRLRARDLVLARPFSPPAAPPAPPR